MKKLIFLTAFVVTGTLTFAQGTKFFQGTFSALADDATKKNSSYFVYFYSNNCNTCNTVDNSFAQTDVAKVANFSFPGLKVDINSKEGTSLATQFSVTKTPAIVFLSPSGDVYRKVEEAVDNQDLVAMMKRYTAVNETK